MTRRRVQLALKAGVWLLGLAPLAFLAAGVAGLTAGGLGANPIDYITDTLGRWTLRFLLASLTMTPLRVLFGLSWPATLRRLLGLFAFFYASLHLSVWVVVDHFFDWPVMWADVLKRPYITVGMTTFVVLLPLAATSTAGMVRRLGAPAWRRLHRLAYAAGVLGVLHFLWLAKVGVVDPYYYAAWLAAVLGVRVWHALARRVRGRREAAAGALGRAPTRP